MNDWVCTSTSYLSLLISVASSPRPGGQSSARLLRLAFRKIEKVMLLLIGVIERDKMSRGNERAIIINSSGRKSSQKTTHENEQTSSISVILFLSVINKALQSSNFFFVPHSLCFCNRRLFTGWMEGSTFQLPHTKRVKIGII